MDAMGKLRRMRFLMNRLPMARMRLHRAWSKATRTTQIISDMPRGQGSGDALEQNEIALDEARTALAAIEKELDELRGWLAPLIRRIDKEFVAECMKRRYLDGKTVAIIANENAYTERNIHYTLNHGEKLVADMERGEQE